MQSLAHRSKTGVIIKYFLVLILFALAGCAENNLEKKKASSPNNVKIAAIKQAQSIKVTFVELGSINCIPCRMMVKVMDDVEKEYDGQVLVRFHDVNSILGRPYAQKYGIRVIPTQVFLDKDGNEYYRHEGFYPKEDLVKVLKMKGVI
jgi:thioredoxin 1